MPPPTYEDDPRSRASRFVEFSRAEWARLRASTPLPLTEAQLRRLVSVNERMSLDEVAQIYLPVSRLLNLYVGATQNLRNATATFLGTEPGRIPFVIGVAGSVAVGKSKGFPESYDLRRLLRFMADVKSGLPEVSAPVYSHLAYDVVPGELKVVRNPDIVIVEGLNVLQAGRGVFVSDFFDFSIYVDANEEDIEQWYVERFLTLRETVFRNPSSYFHRYALLTTDEARETALRIWRDINLLNLRENVLPTRERAHLILVKGRDHAVRRVRLRNL